MTQPERANRTPPQSEIRNAQIEARDPRPSRGCDPRAAHWPVPLPPSTNDTFCDLENVRHACSTTI